MAGGHRIIAIARIRLDGGTQLRAEVEQGVVADYADGLLCKTSSAAGRGTGNTVRRSALEIERGL
jgi:hypothetical protein